MATYEIPAEPPVDVLWTFAQDTGEPIRWVRHENGKGWCAARYGAGWVPWSGLLDRGPVTDVDPDDPSWLPPGPWTTAADDGRAVIDATSNHVLLVDAARLDRQSEDRRLAALIARLVNEHVARQAGAS